MNQSAPNIPTQQLQYPTHKEHTITQQEKEAIVRSESTEDRVTITRTMYDAGSFEIIWRNFLAGASRAMGGIHCCCE